MKRLFNFLVLSSLILLTVKCKEAYEPDVLLSATNLLVVEGFLNGSGTTTIKLSRTQGNDSKSNILERSAIVSVVSESNQSYPLVESSPGVYTTTTTFTISGRYKLVIRTSDGKQYASEEVTLLHTPEVDYVSWKRMPSGVQIYINTHDTQNKTRYYRWEYEETWEIIPPFQSYLELIPNPNSFPFPYAFIQRRPENEFPRACWQSERSENIIMASSNKLTDDVIHLMPISHVPNFSWKLDTRYSILVRQYALSAAGFEYWENMKKNTEGLGSIFDPQPSEIRGNLSCISDPSEQVVGFFDASTIEQERIFISKQDVGGWRYDNGCKQVSAVNVPDSLIAIFPQNIPLDSEIGPGGRASRYTGAAPDCVDCRLKGTPVKPDFW